MTVTTLTQVTPSAVADALDIAADEIECVGWTRNAYFTDEGICLTEALTRASGLRGRYTDHGSRLLDATLVALHRVVDPTHADPADFSITHWNDSQTDPHVVLDALRRAARSTRP